MKFTRGFSEATLEVFLKSVGPMADMVTGGKFSAGTASLAERSEAARIACEEAAEFFAALSVAATEHSLASVQAVVREAIDVKTATKLLADPSAVVTLDGVETTAAAEGLPELPPGDEIPPSDGGGQPDDDEPVVDPAFD